MGTPWLCDGSFEKPTLQGTDSEAARAQPQFAQLMQWVGLHGQGEAVFKGTGLSRHKDLWKGI